jgi:hypothetical protein
MRSSHSVRRLLTTAVLVAAPLKAQAQMNGRVVFTPYVGVYAPSADVFKLSLVQSGTTVSFSAKHLPAAAVGASASVRLDDRFAIEAGGLYSRNTLRADLRTNQVGAPTTFSRASDGSDVWAGTLKLMFETLPSGSEHNLRLGLGPAIITRGGPAYRAVAEGRMEGLTDVGAALSLCTRVPLGTFADLRLRAEDVVYRARQTWESQTVPGASLRSEPRLQQDFVLSLGIQMGLRL